MDSPWYIAFIYLVMIIAMACARTRRSEVPAGEDTSGTRDRSLTARTNKIASHNRIESCVRACNQRTIRRTPARHWSCSARPCNENSIANREWWPVGGMFADRLSQRRPPRRMPRYRGCYVSLSTGFEFCVVILYHSTLWDARKHTSTCTPE